MQTDCFPPGIVFLVRSLLKSRTGVRKSDTVVNYLVRATIQTGGLATAWAIAGLVTWFFLPKIYAFRVIDITSGSIYTHVSDSSSDSLFHLKVAQQAIFDTLLSRAHLREQMSVQTFDLAWTTQVLPYLSRCVVRTKTIVNGL